MRATLRAIARAAIQVTVFVLLVPLSASSALPVFARAVAGPAAHVCTCRSGAHDTSCPVCNPMLRAEQKTAGLDDEILKPAEVRGRCGTDDVAFGGALPPAVLGAASTVASSPPTRATFPPALHDAPPLVSRAPPTPPPEARLA